MGASIKRWHAEKLNRVLRPCLGYLFRLRERMQKVGFLPSDRLYVLVCRAYDSHALVVELHCLSCDGVGRQSNGE